MSDWTINEYGYASKERGVGVAICDGDLCVDYTYPVDTGELVEASLSIPVHVIQTLLAAVRPTGGDDAPMIARAFAAQKAAADVILAARHVVAAQTRSSIDEDHQLCVLANTLATFDALSEPGKEGA